ncbi:sigma-70 family RNA polymerase sigma factor [Streptomyces huasconensis]|uniref:sigma-70 family RNA polymerase sigma factor n=1 Tax=Streptomyces huasconensis TaxID=1854574 RepID=UPI003403E47B
MNDFPEQDFPLAQPAQDEDFVRFFAQHKDEFLRTAISWTRCLEDADEILMNAAVNMCRKWPRIKAHNNPIALARTMLTAARNDFYRQQARRVPEVSFSDLAYTEPVTVDDLLALRGYDRLEQALHRLQARAPQQAECVRLRYTEDLTTAEVAARLNISEGAVRTNVCKGLKNLKHFMDLPTTGKGDS